MSNNNILESMVPTELKITPQTILDVLSDLQDPKTKEPLSKTERLSDIIIAGKRINITLSVSKEECDDYEGLRLEIERRVKSMPALDKLDQVKILVIMTAHKSTSNNPSDNPLFRGRFELSEIKDIVAIASGKGGVGKSTTTVNLAYALRDMGVKVGILDADIYGPSIPKMLDISGEPKVDREKFMIPVEKDGIQIMSMGFLMAEDAPVIWRGPVIQKAIQQFLSQVRWFNLDVLLIDLPPGTGDIQLTLVKKACISGAIVVSTPQDVALIDAKKAIGMFQKVEVPLLGVIENMSYFQCPHCDERSNIFSHGGAHKTADTLKVPFLAEIPLDLNIREMTDTGAQENLVRNIDLGFPYRQAATSLLNQLQKQRSKGNLAA
ncbi:MAG: Mrp/NBP35 family ATP-binding protein [Alphaproteobacteria bacterium]|nr:Mrp/NBP35 family ATP-binding protein [Alphaproteobacteria bacterium]NCQ66247.1 Mrp/NBP35 family ATP-binding protein [Alphaproteobacteria bacterium]NCT06595.1 Mrp/NBP35 family ATP-binding protein [Alphaproteobacteria bacterium]